MTWPLAVAAMTEALSSVTAGAAKTGDPSRALHASAIPPSLPPPASWPACAHSRFVKTHVPDHESSQVVWIRKDDVFLYRCHSCNKMCEITKAALGEILASKARVGL